MFSIVYTNHESIMSPALVTIVVRMSYDVAWRFRRYVKHHNTTRVGWVFVKLRNSVTSVRYSARISDRAIIPLIIIGRFALFYCSKRNREKTIKKKKKTESFFPFSLPSRCRLSANTDKRSVIDCTNSLNVF